MTTKLKYDFAEGKGTTSARALLTAAVASFANDDKQLSANESALGWGVAIGAKYKFTDSLQAMIDYSHVKGDSKFLLYTNNASM